MHEAYGRYLNAQDEARGLSTTTRFLLFKASHERTAGATKGQELLGHFRVKETMYIRPSNRYSRDAMHPDKFQFGTTQILPEKESARLLDTFFRIPSDVDSAEYLARETRIVCAGSHAVRPLNPCTWVQRLPPRSSERGGGGRNRNRRPRDRTPKGAELLTQKAAEITNREELSGQKTRAINERGSLMKF